MSEESRKMAKLAVEALEDKKAEDIKVIDISNVSVIADYFIIAGGNNSTDPDTVQSFTGTDPRGSTYDRCPVRELSVFSGRTPAKCAE